MSGERKRKGNWRLYPPRAFEVDGVLYAQCDYCHGTGKEWRYVSSSNSPGSSEGRMTGKPCLHCRGTKLGPKVEIKKIGIVKRGGRGWDEGGQTGRARC